MRISLVAVALAFTAGIWIGENAGTALWPLGAALIAVAVWFRVNIYSTRARMAAIVLLIMTMGVIRAAWPVPQPNLTGLTGRQAEVEGWVCGDPAVYPDRTVYLLQAEKINQKASEARLQVVIYPPVNQTLFRYGDRLLIYSALNIPRDIRNPGDFSYRDYLARRGVFGQLAVYREDQILHAGGHPAGFIRTSIYDMKQGALKAFEVLPPQEQALVRALLFGSQEGITPELKDSFSRTGVIHVLSVSALHVGLVMAFILGVASLLHLQRHHIFAVLAATLLCYAAMTGFSPSVQRAALMGLVAWVGYAYHQSRHLYNSLALAALVILTVQPYSLFEPGFQLSFIAAWGLIYLGPWIYRGLQPIPGGKALSAVLAAELVIWPLTAYYFNLVSVISVISNLVIVGLVTILVNMGWIAVLTGAICWPLGKLVADAAGAVAGLLLAAVGLFDRWPYSAFIVPAPGHLFLVGYFLLLAAVRENWVWRLWTAIRLRQAGKRAAAVILLMLTLALGWNLVRVEKLAVTIFDVGQGDCILIRVPGYGNCLIDSGGRPAYQSQGRDFGEVVVLPLLRRAGVSNLALLVITHDHDDHTGGAEAVLRSMPVQNLIVSDGKVGASELSSNMQSLLAVARNQGTAILEVNRGDDLILGEARLTVMHPRADAVGEEDNENNNSVVLRLSYREESFLFSGDAETEALVQMVKSGRLPVSTILKLPHHGSGDGFCPEFYDRVSPKAVVVSVGKNSFGHPDPGVSAYWRSKGVPLYRTDQDGALIMSTDGSGVTIRTVASGRNERIPDRRQFMLK